MESGWSVKLTDSLMGATEEEQRAGRLSTAAAFLTSLFVFGSRWFQETLNTSCIWQCLVSFYKTPVKVVELQTASPLLLHSVFYRQTQQACQTEFAR